MMNLVSFRGEIGAGKSYAARYLANMYKFERIAFADALKTEIYDLLWTEGHNRVNFPALRQFAAETGVDANTLPVPRLAGISNYYHVLDMKRDWVDENKAILRPLLQWWGTNYRRQQNVNYWTDQWQIRVLGALKDGRRVVVDDARFDNEINLAITMGGAHIFILTNEEDCKQRITIRDGALNLGLANHASERTMSPHDPRNAACIANIVGGEPFDEILNRLVQAFNAS